MECILKETLEMHSAVDGGLHSVNRAKNSITAVYQSKLSLKNSASKILTDVKSKQQAHIAHLATTETTRDDNVNAILLKIRKQHIYAALLLTEEILA